MVIPKICEDYINKQRTNYKDVQKDYEQDLKKEFNQMLEFLPEHCNRIIDIGCGIAGIDYFFNIKYDNPVFYLIDAKISSRRKKIKYGFSDVKSYYNSFRALKEFLDKNNFQNYHLCDIKKQLPVDQVDIILSLFAAGFHFSIKKYIEYINNCLLKDGILIIDIRKTMQEQELKIVQKYFSKIDYIKTDNPKTIRICARKKNG